MLLLKRLTIAAVLLAAAAVPSQAASIQLFSYGAMTPGFDTVTYPGADNSLHNPLIAPGPGNQVTINDGVPPIQRMVQGSSWNGNFGFGERLAWTQGGNNNPMQIDFLNPVSEFGFQIQADFFGSFTALFDVYNGATLIGSFNRLGSSNSNGDDSAIFLGAQANGGDAITRILVSVVLSNGDGDFAINEVSYNGASAIPEPATMFLFGTGLTALAARRRRMKAKLQ